MTSNEPQRAFLTENYASLGLARCAAHLGWGQTKTFIVAKALGLSCRRRWRPEEDAFALNSAGDLTLAAMQARVGRSAVAIQMRRRAHGVGMGCPQGFEYLTHAATRLGYETSQIRQILAWADVRIRPAFSRKGSVGGRFIVESDAATEAVARWCSMYTAVAAAKELGVSDTWVLEHVRTDPRATRAGSLWRIPPEVVENLRSLVRCARCAA